MAYGAEARRAVANGEPTPKQKLLLRAIYELSHEAHRAPTFREIADRLGVGSTNGITEGLNKLQKMGWLVRDNLVNRSTMVTRRGMLAAGITPKGDPFVADDPPG